MVVNILILWLIFMLETACEIKIKFVKNRSDLAYLYACIQWRLLAVAVFTGLFHVSQGMSGKIGEFTCDQGRKTSHLSRLSIYKAISVQE